MRNLRVLLAISAILTGAMAWAADLAKVNGKPVTDKDVRAALGGLSDAQRESILKDTNTRRQVLDSVVDQELLVQQAEKEKMDQDQEYKDALSAFRKQYLATKILQKNLSTKMTQTAEKKYYEAHKTRFSTDQVHAQHILIRNESEVQEVLKKAKEPNADFQELAEHLSKDPSAKNNRGDLGFFGRDRMVPEFTEAAFAAKDGEIVGPIKTSYGYHIIKVIERKAGKTLGFDEVELKVRNELRNELTQSYLSGLKKQAKVEVDEKALNKM